MQQKIPRFAIVVGIHRYFSEKIFNCLFANTIPIYSGSSIIHNFINKDCFVNINNNDNKLNVSVENIIKNINNSKELFDQYINAPKINADIEI